LRTAVDAVPQAAALDREPVRARARERLDVDRMVEAYVEVYRMLLEEPG